MVRITPQTADLPPERVAQLIADLEAARPAGVKVELLGARVPLKVNMDIKLITQPRLPETDLRRAHDAVTKTLTDYFAALPLRADASLNQIVGRVLAVPGVIDAQLLSARVPVINSGLGSFEERIDAAAGVIRLAQEPTVLGELHISDPNLPTSVTVVVHFPAAGPTPDPTQTQTALAAALAYLNDLANTPFASGDAVAVARRTLSLRKILGVLPLPGRAAQTLVDIDAGAPTPTLSDVAPFIVSAFVQQSNGLTKALLDDGASYALTTGERLGLTALTLTSE